MLFQNFKVAKQRFFSSPRKRSFLEFFFAHFRKDIFGKFCDALLSEKRNGGCKRSFFFCSFGVRASLLANIAPPHRIRTQDEFAFFFGQFSFFLCDRRKTDSPVVAIWLSFISAALQISGTPSPRVATGIWGSATTPSTASTVRSANNAQTGSQSWLPVPFTPPKGLNICR